MATVLIVDDSSFSRRILRKMLESAEHQVVEAEDGIVALERYALERPDLVLLDMNMAGMHGLDVLRKLRELDATANIIIATADIQSSTRTLTEAGGARGFVPKPFVAERVLRVVNEVLTGDG